jgi:hypothetical protein
VLIFLYKTVKLIIVYTEAEATIRLSDKEDKKDEGKAVKHNKPFVKVFLASTL